MGGSGECSLYYYHTLLHFLLEFYRKTETLVANRRWSGIYYNSLYLSLPFPDMLLVDGRTELQNLNDYHFPRHGSSHLIWFTFFSCEHQYLLRCILTLISPG